MEKYTEEWYQEEAKRYKNLFYKYSGIPAGTPITKELIKEHRLGAFGKVCCETGCDDRFLKDALLKDWDQPCDSLNEDASNLAEVDPSLKFDEKFFTEQLEKDAYDYLLRNYELELRSGNVKKIVQDICEDRNATPLKTTLFGILNGNISGGLLAYIGEEIPEGMFTDVALKSITIPSSIVRIGSKAFYKCSSLTNITISSSVTSIGKTAFAYCSDLTSITIPNSVTSIDDSAFWYCSGLTEITIPSGVKSISEDAFYGCSSLISITIPSSVTHIGKGAFYYCRNLTSINIPSSVRSIGQDAFRRCAKLTSVTFSPNSQCSSIGVSAFYNCSSLTSITIPESVKSIGDYAFYECSNLTSITIPEGVKSISEDAFYNCTNLQYNEYNGGKYLGNSTNPYMALIKGTAISGIHQDTKIISGGAFSGCSSLTSITIPESVKSIGDYAFSGCSSLRSITIPEGVRNIRQYAFRKCPNLTLITFQGTKEQWYAAMKGYKRPRNKGSVIRCTDGDLLPVGGA